MNKKIELNDDITLYCGDCLDVLKTLEAGSVDAVITDPPYGTRDGRGKVMKRGNNIVTFDVGDWDAELPLDWIAESMNAIVDGAWAAIFTDKLSVNILWQFLEELGWHGKQTFHWIKTNPPPQPRSNFASGIESAVVATNGVLKSWYGGGWRPNYFIAPIVGGDERSAHPTQKPVKLIEYLIESFTKSGDTVLDPFMGSGTTGVACVQTGRKFIGIEIDERYFDIAVKRIQMVMMQPRLDIFTSEQEEKKPAVQSRKLLE